MSITLSKSFFLLAALSVLATFACARLPAQDSKNDVTQKEIETIRKGHVLWAPVEAGAPMIYIGDLPDKISELKDPSVDESRYAAVLEKLMEKYTLKPGTYKLKNFWKKLYPDKKISLGMDTTYEISIPDQDVIEFTVTENHLKLLHHANIRRMGFDFKRPYGDMTFFYIDMADALGIPLPPCKTKSSPPDFSKEQFDKFDKLHGEMMMVLQAWLENAKFTDTSGP